MVKWHPCIKQQPPVYYNRENDKYCSPIIFKLTIISTTKCPQRGYKTILIVVP